MNCNTDNSSSYLYYITLNKTSRYPQGNNHGARAIIKVLGHQYKWLAGGYELEIGHF